MQKLIIFDSHPVQYRVPIYLCLQNKIPNQLLIVYASDCSVKGHDDKGFGKVIKWDEPLLSGYENEVLNTENGTPLNGWKSLTGKGVKQLIDREKPNVIMLTGLNYKYDWTVCMYAYYKGIPVWLRCETQDQANNRSKKKEILRFLLYKSIYKFISKFFYIGELNKMHYLKHGVDLKKLFPAKYCSVNRFANLTHKDKIDLRQITRNAASICEDKFVIGFSGKLIEKKNPKIIFDALPFLHPELLKKTHLYFLGSGELINELHILANQAKLDFGINTTFTGFVNQTEIASHYLAMDILVLPSRRMGETWGLVANEAMQSGCGVIVSNAVGSSEDFKNSERFKVFSDGEKTELAKAIHQLSKFERDFDWAVDVLIPDYTIDQNAKIIADCL